MIKDVKLAPKDITDKVIHLIFLVDKKVPSLRWNIAPTEDTMAKKENQVRFETSKSTTKPNNTLEISRKCLFIPGGNAWCETWCETVLMFPSWKLARSKQREPASSFGEFKIVLWVRRKKIRRGWNSSGVWVTHIWRIEGHARFHVSNFMVLASSRLKRGNKHLWIFVCMGSGRLMNR